MTVIKRAFTPRSIAPGLERGALVALILLSATFALESIRPVLNLGGLLLTNVELLLFLTLGLWILALVAVPRRPAVPRTVALPAVIWLIVLFVSALLAPSHRFQSLKFSARMATGVLAAWAAYDLARETGRRNTLLRALALGGLLVGVLGLAEAGGLPLVDRLLASFKQDPTFIGELRRVSSTLGYATIASMVLESTVPLLLAWMLAAARRWGRALLAAGLLAALAAQALTLTRAGLIALLAALGFMAAWAFWHRRRKLLLSSLATGLVLLALWAATLVWNPLARYRLVSETEQNWYQAVYQAPSQLAVPTGETVPVRIIVTNASVRTWQARGDNPFTLGYHLTRPDGSLAQFDGGHFALPHDVPAGTQVEVQASVSAPAEAGEYVIEWDMVHEGVTWFKWEGTASGRTYLSAAGSTSRPAATPGPGQLDGASPPPAVPMAAGEQGRLWLWGLAARMVTDRPILGVGPDNFRWLHAAYAGVEEADDRIHANNLYIEWLADTGVVGLAAFLWLTWGLARVAHSALRDDGRGASNMVWQVAVTASLVAWFVHGLLDFFYEFTPTYLAFALLCGLALAGTPPPHQKGSQCASDST